MSENKIILGGDDDYFRGTLFTHLEEAGYGVVLLARTTDVVKAATGDSGDVVLMMLDLECPRLDVAVALRTVHAERPNLKIPVIAVRTPDEDPARIQALRQAGVRSFVDKKMPMNEILYLVRQLITPSKAERRKHPRVPSHVPVEYWSENESHRSGYVTDLSEGGVFIQTFERYALGQMVNTRFTLPEMDWILEGSGEVVYISPKSNRKTALLPGMGIKFRDLAPSHASALRAYVERVLRRLPDLYDKSLIGIDKSS